MPMPVETSEATRPALRPPPAAKAASTRTDDILAPTAAPKAKVAADAAADDPIAAAARSAVSQTAQHARLSYDDAQKRTYVEILDPKTGDVLFRFPPEAMQKNISDLLGDQPGALYDRKV